MMNYDKKLTDVYIALSPHNASTFNQGKKAYRPYIRHHKSRNWKKKDSVTRKYESNKSTKRIRSFE